MMHDDDRDFEQLAATLRRLDAPPPAPRDALWARIQAQRGVPEHADVIPLRPRTARRSWAQWSAALAAMLVLGIGLGRVSIRQPATPAVPPTAASPAATENGAVPGAFRFAATQHLQRTEALLASLSVDADAGSTQEVSQWAGDLLTNTRLLLSSPAAEDPATRRLLEDLELLLAQVAAIPAARASEEVELIQDGLNQSDVLLRLRAATAGRRSAGT